MTPHQDQSPDRARLLLHPERSRIVLMLHEAPLTAQELRVRLPDIPLGSLYRHLNLLIEADWVETIGKARNRKFAPVFRSNYLSSAERERITAESLPSLARLILEIVDRSFVRFAAQAEFPLPDGEVALVNQALWLTDEEYEAFRSQVKTLFALADREPTPGMRRRMIAYFAVPEPEDSGASLEPGTSS